MELTAEKTGSKGERFFVQTSIFEKASYESKSLIGCCCFKQFFSFFLL